MDKPEILQFIFYPRRDWTPVPPGAKDYLVPVEADVSISCRFYPGREGSPCILYFHGNGEVACDYDWFAPYYNQLGISLFVADYRGYGLSGGSPTLSILIKDAEPVFDFFVKRVGTGSPKAPLFLMGRSLGALSVMALASHHPDYVKGLIIESGAVNMARMLRLLDFPLNYHRLETLEEAALAVMRAITLPVLILHGEWDSLIPASEGITFYETVGSREKKLVLIPGADHNDIMLVGKEQYFSAIREFVSREGV